MTGTFLLVVFAARFVLEFFKTPQAAYEAGFSISVGQWLSVPFMLIGTGLIFRALRSARPAPVQDVKLAKRTGPKRKR